MSVAPVKLTKTLETPRKPDFSLVPPLIAAWLSDQGKNLVLQNGHRDQVAFLHAYGMSTLFAEDLPEDQRQEMTREARLYGFDLRDGVFTKGDCMLYFQDESARAAMEEDAADLFRMQDTGSLDKSIEAFDEIGRGAPGRNTVRAAIPDDVVARRLTDHVGPAIPPGVLGNPRTNVVRRRDR